ncbi:MAG: hypothetical protein VKL39_20820 [Leptolyngbyaceae bacterium]|nr:hypothetical protein [Leptolyngbyaceae bacterium]
MNTHLNPDHCPAGADLFSGFEGFVHALSEGDESTIAGGKRSNSDRRRRKRRRRRRKARRNRSNSRSRSRS